MFLSTNEFFFMFARHMCSGSPVLADCSRTKSSGDCVPSPIGSVRVHVQIARLADALDQIVDRDLAQHLARALTPCACRARSARRSPG